MSDDSEANQVSRTQPLGAQPVGPEGTFPSEGTNGISAAQAMPVGGVPNSLSGTSTPGVVVHASEEPVAEASPVEGEGDQPAPTVEDKPAPAKGDAAPVKDNGGAAK